MLAFDPTHRLTIPEILSHPWMTGDMLMGEELEKEMRQIEVELVQKKRRAVLKNLQGKNIQINKHANRSLADSVDIAKAVNKGTYRK
jgi:hypothetical protein